MLQLEYIGQQPAADCSLGAWLASIVQVTIATCPVVWKGPDDNP